VSVSLELRGEGDRRFRAIVRDGYDALTRALAGVERTLPAHVDREFRAYFACGDPAEGFAWLVCPACDHHRLVLFSCKTRGFCPSCGGRRMAERAADWVDRVLPRVATRQWVLTVPWKRRWILARRPDLAGGVLGVACKRIEAWYRRATGRSDGKSGAVVAIQRFGSALNLNLHFHIVHLDGVYSRGADGRLRFLHASPHTGDVEALVVDIAERCEAWLARRGYGPEDEVDAEGDDAQAVLQEASLLGKAALGGRAGRRARRVQTVGGREQALPERCAAYLGYNVHAGVSLRASERTGLERLCRYVLRPPVAAGRVERLDDEHVRVGLKRAWSDGTTSLLLSPLELAERLAAIVPPPRANQVIYRGVLAGNAAWRKEVVPTPPKDRVRRRKLTRVDVRPKDDDRLGWADLLERVFAVDGWRCLCGQPMELRTIVIRPPATTRVVDGLARATGPP
jgi:putative transposase/transposase-like zinc-binding protein